MPQLETWIDPDDLSTIYSSDYWNDIEHEKKKPWWITDVNDQKLHNYLTSTGLQQELESTLNLVEDEISGNILDVASGVCWTSAHLSKNPQITSVDALEFSLHRIDTIAPIAITNLGGNHEKINRILGSFYDIKRPEKYYDAILLSQSFHHAEFPLKLFHECDRVLKDNGVLIIIGDHVITPWRKFKWVIKSFLRGKPTFNTYKLFYNHNDPLGDHLYRLSDYQFMFFAYGYSFQIIKSKWTNTFTFIAKKGGG